MKSDGGLYVTSIVTFKTETRNYNCMTDAMEIKTTPICNPPFGISMISKFECMHVGAINKFV